MSAARGLVVLYRHFPLFLAACLALSSSSSSGSDRAGAGELEEVWQQLAGWGGSVAAGHRQGPCNGLVLGDRVQFVGLQRCVCLGAPTWDAHRLCRLRPRGHLLLVVCIAARLGTTFPHCVLKWAWARRPACVPIWSWVESPLVCVAGFFGCGPCQRSLPSDSSLCFPLDVGFPPFRAVSSLLSGPAKDFPCFWGSLQRSCVIAPVTPFFFFPF